jgi:predicted phage terminase large subunit-like protein
MKFSKAQVLASLCKESFEDFVRSFWHVIISDELKWNWHLSVICDALQEAAERVFLGLPKKGDIVVNVCPGSSKSTIASIMYPMWIWARMPHAKIICASYAEKVALDLSRKCRDVAKSDLYRECFPGIQLREDQDTKGYFANTKGGQRFAAGSMGAVQGMHGHFIIIDDPINPVQTASEIELYNVNDWIKGTLSGRKVDKVSSLMALIMQRLHQDDPTALFLERGNIQHYCIPAELTPDVKPDRLREMYVDGLMDPGRMPRYVLDEIRKDMGEFAYCTPGFTPILMSSFKEKMIEDVEVGDEVVGFTQAGEEMCDRRRSHLVKSKVVKKSSRIAEVVRLVMASGREVYCTPDHHWWTNRTIKDVSHKQYLPARVGSNLHSVYEPFTKPEGQEQRIFDWLGGLIDGEGSCRHSQLQITQAPGLNQPICDRIDKVLRRLDIPHTRYTHDYDYPDKRYPEGRESNRGMRYCWNILGGRSTRIRILNSCLMVKSQQIIDGLWRRCGGVSEKKDRVVRIEPAGQMRVYGLTTATGNYVAWGYASKNCGQFLQTPVPRSGGMFDPGQIKLIGYPRKMMRTVRYWDKAGTPSKQKGGRGAYTVGVKMGIDENNFIHIIDVIRVRVGSFDREILIRETAEEDGHDVIVATEQEPGPIYEEERVQMADGLNKKLRKVKVGDRVIDMDGLPREVTAVYEQGLLGCLEIETESGRVIKAAGDHPFLTPGGWIRADKLEVGTVLALRSNAQIVPSYNRTVEEARLAGYFVGDGCCTFARRDGEVTKGINANVVCSDPVQGEDIVRCAESIGASVRLGGSKGWTYSMSKGIRPWLWDVGLAGKTTLTKTVPEWVMSGSNEVVANFIGAYFACDGCVSLNKKTFGLEFYSTGNKLLRQVQSLLLRFGIYSRLRTRTYQPDIQATRKIMYRLVINRSDDSQGRFASLIPVYGKKAERLSQIGRRDFDKPYLADPIVRIESVGKLPCRCIEVEEGHSFIVNDLIVHNSGGKESAEGTLRNLTGFVVVVDRPTGDKETRADPFSVQVNAGNVYMVVAPWNKDYLDEMRFFPFSTTKDQIDASAGALGVLTKARKRVGALRYRNQPQLEFSPLVSARRRIALADE